jgi:hypothetical protein
MDGLKIEVNYLQIKLRAKSTYRMWQGCSMHHLLQAIAGASGRPTRAVNGKVVC